MVKVAGSNRPRGETIRLLDLTFCSGKGQDACRFYLLARFYMAMPFVKSREQLVESILYEKIILWCHVLL